MKVIVYSHYYGYGMGEIANLCGVSRQVIHRHKSKAIRALKNKLNFKKWVTFV